MPGRGFLATTIAYHVANPVSRRVIVGLLAGVLALTGFHAARALTVVSDVETGSAGPHLQYVGQWELVRGRHDGRVSGASHRTLEPGAVAIFAFTGTFVRIYGVNGPKGGVGMVTIDDRPYGDVSFYSPVKVARKLVFQSPPLSAGPHVLQVTATGRSPLSQHRGYVNIGAVAYQ